MNPSLLRNLRHRPSRSYSPSLLCNLRRLILYSFFFTLSLAALAQPGGGGGLSINYFTPDGKLVEEFTNMQLQLMSDFYSDEVRREESNTHALRNLPPDVFILRYDASHYPIQTAHWRVIWPYQQDTMVVDFENMNMGNGMGITPSLDSLVFMPGHYLLNCEDLADFSVGKPTAVSPRNKSELIERGILQIRPKISNFKNYGFDYYYDKALQLFQTGDLDDANLFVQLASTKSKSPLEQKLLLLLRERLAMTVADYDTALKLLDQWAELDSSDLLYSSYIELYRAQQNYEACIPYFEKKLKWNYSENSVRMEYATFLAFDMHRYSEALAMLEPIRASIPKNCMHDRPIGSCDYNELLYLLGKIHLANNHTSEGFRYFLLACQFNLQGSTTDEYINYFESLQATYPNAPELDICIAFCKLFKAPYMGWGNQTNALLYEANTLCVQALAKGYKTFIAYYCQAYVNYVRKDYELALTAVDKAMSLDSTDARPYLLKGIIISSGGLKGDYKYWQNEFHLREPDWKITW